jgi:hypothetical protein
MRLTIASLICAVSVIANAQERVSTHYHLVPETMDSGGASFSAHYATRTSMGIFDGITTATIPDSFTIAGLFGFVMQLDEPLFPQADLIISISPHPEGLERNGKLFYEVKVTNRGPDTAANVVVRVNARGNHWYDRTLTGGFSYLHEPEWLNFAIGDLPAGQSAFANAPVDAVVTEFMEFGGPHGTGYPELLVKVEHETREPTPADNFAHTIYFGGPYWDGSITISPNEHADLLQGKYVAIGENATLFIDGPQRLAGLDLNGTIKPTTNSNALELIIDDAIRIGPAGAIDVSEKGYLGGSQPGNTFSGRRPQTFGASDQPIPGVYLGGGSYGGFASGSESNPLYGSYLAPTHLGSGGSDAVQCCINSVGGNGGGRIHIRARSLQLDGAMRANGGKSWAIDFGVMTESGGGSGGSIFVELAGGAFTGTGALEARGGASAHPGRHGGGGRIAVVGYSTSAFVGDLNEAGTIYTKPATGDANLFLGHSAFGVEAGATMRLASLRAGMNRASYFDNRGTLFIEGQKIAGNLQLRNQGEITVVDDHLVIRTNVVLIQDQIIKPVRNVTIENGGVITHTGGFGVQLDIAERLDVRFGGAIDVTGKGYRGGTLEAGIDGRPSIPASDGTAILADYTGGGSHGSLSASHPNTNPLYGSPFAPTLMGAGGSAIGHCCGASGGNGGGRIHIRAHDVAIDGALVADGAPGLFNFQVGDPGGGAGGSIFVEMNGGTFIGSGSLTAAGGASLPRLNHVGGGGRIAVVGFRDNTFIGASSEAGTVFLQKRGTAGDLLLNGTTHQIASGTSQRLNSISAIGAAVSTVHNEGTLELESNHFLVGSNLFFFQDGVVQGVTVANSIGAATVANGGFLTHSQGRLRGMQLNVAGPFVVETGGLLNVDFKGYLGGFQNNDASGRAQTYGPNGEPVIGNYTGGGSYGTLSPSDTNPLYGSATAPAELGSGGSSLVQCCGASGGNGGGRIYVRANSIRVDGSLTANGGDGLHLGDLGDSGGGSGGSIFLEVTGGDFTGTGTVNAHGGRSRIDARKGGCGRIAIVGQSRNTFAGVLGPDCASAVFLGEPAPEITPPIMTGGSIKFTWRGRTLRLESRSGLDPGSSWGEAGEVITSNGDESTVEIQPTDLKKFYRLRSP